MLHFGVGRSNIEVQKSLFVALRDGCRCADSESAFGALRKQIEERSWLTATRMTQTGHRRDQRSQIGVTEYRVDAADAHTGTMMAARILRNRLWPPSAR
jgi:hypothetical protein